MPVRPSRPAVLAITLLAGLLALAGCGRRGELEPPAGVSIPTPEPMPTVFGTSTPTPAAEPAPVSNKPFLLDFLI